ncbi:MAG: hypothetical protein FJ265_19855, partial [Planctomycetes bacterium]|nr:hypothetical protein [Planctomycetota bacterium]
MRLPTLTVLALILPASSLAQSPATASFAGVSLYDAARQRLVVGTTSLDVWEWDGATWALSSARLPATPVRAIYHPVRKTSLWFSALNLYEFDGHAFADRGPAPANANVLLAVDTHRDRLVVLDAVSTTLRLREWDGQTWSTGPQVAGMVFPMGLAYDEPRQRCVATVLRISGGVFYDTMEWDGQAWTVFTMGAPVRRSVAFDPVRQQVVSFSAGVEGWTGSQWVGLPVSSTKAPLYFSADPANGRLFGVVPVSGSHEFWTWDGFAWSFVQRSPHPIVTDLGFTFDTARGRAVLLYAPGAVGQMGHVEWDGVRWHDRVDPSTPPRRANRAQVHDPLRGETLMFGGFPSGSTPTDELWGFDGTAWTLRSTGGPGPRFNAAMTFDSVRGDVVLVGGQAATGAFLTDLWRWNGAAWTLVLASNPLTSLAGPIAFDPLRDAVVMVDGFGVTFEFTGSGWVLAASGMSPPVTNLVFDFRRGRVVTTMNATPVTGISRHEWTGAQWLPIPGAIGELAYDPGRGLMLNYMSNRLLVESSQPALAEHLGDGCGGTAI